MENKDKPAFPRIDLVYASEVPREGLTKREYFAGLAMQGIMSNATAIGVLNNTNESIPLIMESLAKKSIELADELLKQLEHGTE